MAENRNHLLPIFPWGEGWGEGVIWTSEFGIYLEFVI